VRCLASSFQKSLKEIASKRVAEELKKGVRSRHLSTRLSRRQQMRKVSQRVDSELGLQELKEKVAKLKSGGDGAAARVRLHKHVMEELRKRLECVPLISSHFVPLLIRFSDLCHYGDYYHCYYHGLYLVFFLDRL
jgi:uncharacterized sporulation protein YeaH/YhbH (DUF444 family)